MSTATAPVQGHGRLAHVRRLTTSSYIGIVVLTAIVVALAIGPFAFLTKGNQGDLTVLFVFIILGSMWNLLAGYAGMVSIGQQAFIGLGAYGIVWAADSLGLPVLIAIPIAMVAAGIVAYLVSFLAFRLAGGYFAIGTWVIAEVIKMLITLPQFNFLGAGGGVSLTAFAGYKPEMRIALVFWMALGAAVVCVLITYFLMRSRLGAGFTAIRDDATAAATLGVNVTRSKRIVWVIAAMGTGLGGAIWAANALRVQPETVFDVQWAAFMIFIVVIGGIGSIEGPILGAIVYFALWKWLSNSGVWYLVILGAIAIGMVLFFPKGLWGLISGNGRVRLFPTGLRLTNASTPVAPDASTPVALSRE